MHIKDWMTTPALMIKPKDTVAHAREILETKRIRQLPVAVNGRLVGIISDRDLRDAFPSVFADAKKSKTVSPETILIETVMSEKVLTLRPDDLLEEAAQLMHKERIGAIPIVEDDLLVGIIARADVLRAFTVLTQSSEWDELAREALRPTDA